MAIPKIIQSLAKRAGYDIRPRTRATSTGAYDAASTRRRIANWNATDAGINSLLTEAGETLRARSHDIVRKNPWASRIVDEYVADAIGTGIVPQSKHENGDVRRAIRALWNDFVEESDAHGLTNLYGQMALILRSMIVAGEVLIRKRPRLAQDGLAVPLQLQVLEPEHLPWALNRMEANGNVIRNGIEFDRIGRRVAYHLYREHPGELPMFGAAREITRVPADQIIHAFRVLRPGQVRGEPWLAKILTKLWHLDQYEDAQLDKQKIAAMMVGFITEPNPEDSLPGNETDTAGSETAPDGTDFLSLEPGTLQKLVPGEAIEFSTPPTVGDYEPFSRQQLRGAAAGVGMPYDKVSGDLTQVNYSSIRAGLLAYRRIVEQFQFTQFIWQVCRPIYNAFLEQAALSGALNLPGYAANPRPYRKVEWRTPRWDWVDPEKDIKAEQLLVDNLWKPDSAVINELGYDEDEVYDMIAADQKRQKELGLQKRSKSTTGAQQQDQQQGASQ